MTEAERWANRTAALLDVASFSNAKVLELLTGAPPPEPEPEPEPEPPSPVRPFASDPMRYVSTAQLKASTIYSVAEDDTSGGQIVLKRNLFGPGVHAMALEMPAGAGKDAQCQRRVSLPEGCRGLWMQAKRFRPEHFTIDGPVGGTADAACKDVFFTVYPDGNGRLGWGDESGDEGVTSGTGPDDSDDHAKARYSGPYNVAHRRGKKYDERLYAELKAGTMTWEKWIRYEGEDWISLWGRVAPYATITTAFRSVVFDLGMNRGTADSMFSAWGPWDLWTEDPRW